MFIDHFKELESDTINTIAEIIKRFNGKEMCCPKHAGADRLRLLRPLEQRLETIQNALGVFRASGMS